MAKNPGLYSERELKKRQSLKRRAQAEINQIEDEFRIRKNDPDWLSSQTAKRRELRLQELFQRMQNMGFDRKGKRWVNSKAFVDAEKRVGIREKRIRTRGVSVSGQRPRIDVAKEVEKWDRAQRELEKTASSVTPTKRRPLREVHRSQAEQRQRDRLARRLKEDRKLRTKRQTDIVAKPARIDPSKESGRWDPGRHELVRDTRAGGGPSRGTRIATTPPRGDMGRGREYLFSFLGFIVVVVILVVLGVVIYYVLMYDIGEIISFGWGYTSLIAIAILILLGALIRYRGNIQGMLQGVGQNIPRGRIPGWLAGVIIFGLIGILIGALI